LPPFSVRAKKKPLPDAGRGFFFNGCGLDGTRTRDLRRDRAAF
jgi:hypothetical protein